MGHTTRASFTSVTPRQIRVIGVPLDLGQSRRGVDMGPSAVRVAGLEARLEAIGHKVEDAGNIAVAIPEQKKEGAANAKYLKEITATCTKAADLVLKTLEAGKVPMVLGGDHSIAVGTVSGVAEFYRRQNQKIGLIWIDAHTDMNTPDSSPSGNVQGMPLASIMGLPPVELGKIYDFSPKVQPENCVLVGIRDVDNYEKENIRKAGVEVFTMRDIDERGMRAVMEEALRMAGRGTAGYHVSLDMDWIDPEDAPGVGTPVWGGATYREAHLAMEIVSGLEARPGYDRAYRGNIINVSDLHQPDLCTHAPQYLTSGGVFDFFADSFHAELVADFHARLRANIQDHLSSIDRRHQPFNNDCPRHQLFFAGDDFRAHRLDRRFHGFANDRVLEVAASEIDAPGAETVPVASTTGQ